jgi:tetratricopeptide (TPR) repeat protein
MKLKSTSITILIICFLSGNLIYSQKYAGELAKTGFNLSPDRLNFFKDMFETKKQLYTFLEIKNGETIAEVGADDGINLGILSMLYDSLTLYAQDIDAKCLTQKSLNKEIKYYSKKRTTPQTNTFKWVIGTMNSTNLPANTFDKIFLIDAYHDFDKKDDMIEDIAAKLKPNGQIIFLDGFSFIGDTQVCPFAGRHVVTTLEVELKRFEKHGFYLTKMRAPNYNGAHYGQGLVFERNKPRSDEFYKLQKAIESFALQSSRFSQKAIASDSMVMKQITDSILPKINGITFVYPEYELWIKDISIRYLRKSDYLSAINIFKSNVRFFPDSYQTYYWLGLAYQENKQYDLALKNLKQSLALNPNNKNCTDRIKTVEKLN